MRPSSLADRLSLDYTDLSFFLEVHFRCFFFNNSLFWLSLSSSLSFPHLVASALAHFGCVTSHLANLTIKVAEEGAQFHGLN